MSSNLSDAAANKDVTEVFMSFNPDDATAIHGWDSKTAKLVVLCGREGFTLSPIRDASQTVSLCLW